jgi:hypothetical protein
MPLSHRADSVRRKNVLLRMAVFVEADRKEAAQELSSAAPAAGVLRMAGAASSGGGKAGPKGSPPACEATSRLRWIGGLRGQLWASQRTGEGAGENSAAHRDGPLPARAVEG